MPCDVSPRRAPGSPPTTTTPAEGRRRLPVRRARRWPAPSASQAGVPPPLPWERRMNDRVLTDEQIAGFLDRGYVTVSGCFNRAQAKPWLDAAWVRLGYDPDDPRTWRERRVHMPSGRRVDVKDFAPKVWRAVCELLGGEDRIAQPYTWGDGFIANLGLGSDEPWRPPSPASPGWHKDGDFFRHFLDSPEQALLAIVLWS